MRIPRRTVGAKPRRDLFDGRTLRRQIVPFHDLTLDQKLSPGHKTHSAQELAWRSLVDNRVTRLYN
jgi:hypothetical protein